MSRPLPAAAALPGAAETEARRRTRAGIITMCAVSLIFAVQDTMTRKLGGDYSAWQITMLRYWFFAAFSVAVVARQPGGLRAAARSFRPGLQVVRGLLLLGDVLGCMIAFVALGLVNTHAVFAVYPLLVVALSGPMLGERIGWRRWTAVGVGFLGILVILQPGAGGFPPVTLVALGAALCFALYGVLTRIVSAQDGSMTSFLWTSVVGALATTPPGLMHWGSLTAGGWGLLALLCACAATSHILLIRAYTLAEASVIQPFAYTQLAWISVFGLVLFGERITSNVVLGVAIVVGAGLFSLWRARVRAG